MGLEESNHCESISGCLVTSILLNVILRLISLRKMDAFNAPYAPVNASFSFMQYPKRLMYSFLGSVNFLDLSSICSVI